MKTIRQRKNRAVNLFAPSKKLLDFDEETFKRLYRKEKSEDEKLTTEEKKMYDMVIYLSKLDDIYEWVSEVLAEVECENRRKTLGQVPSRWKFWRKHENKQGIEEVVEVLIEENISKSYVWLVFQLNFTRGSLELSQFKEQSYGQESLHFTIENCFFESKIRLQGGSIDLILDNLLLQSSKDSEITQIFEKMQPNNEPLLNLSIDINPIHLPVSYSLIFSTQPLVIDYTPEAFILINSFFTVPETQESIKTAAWDTLQGLQDTTKETLTDMLYGDTKYYLSFKIRGPQVKIPTFCSGKFLLDLGLVEMQNGVSQEGSEYESLDFTLSGIKLMFENEEIFRTAICEPVIPEFAVNWKLSFLKEQYKTMKWKLNENSLDSFPDLIFKGELVQFQLVITPSNYNRLKNLTEAFDVERKSLRSSINDISRKSVMSSYLKRKGKNIQRWNSYFAVLSGGYIYFFLNDEEKAPKNYYYIKDCSIDDVYGLGLDFCINLRNRYGECILSFNSAIELHFWKRSLNEQIQEFESSKSVAKSVIEDIRDANKQRIKLEFNILSFNIILCNEQQDNIAEFNLQKIRADIIISPYNTSINLTLFSLYIRDMIRTNSQKFTILAQSTTEGMDLISIECKLFSPKSPEYRDKDLQIYLTMRALEVNWNPDFVSSILNFFEFADYSDPGRVVQKKLIVKPDHILCEFLLHVESVNLFLNNVEKGVSIGIISIFQLNVVVCVKDGGSESKGSLGNLEISDLTNYPKTAVGLGGKIKLFSVRKQSKMMLEFQVCTYYEENPKKLENVSSEIEVKMQSVKLHYYNQPIIRIIDYLMYKVLGVLDSGSRVKNIHTFKSEYRLSHLLGSLVVQAIKSESDQKKLGFTSMKITISNPLLKFVPRPGQENYFVMDLGDIYIFNTQTSDKSRGPDEILIDLYTVTMNNIIINSMIENLTHDIATEFNLLLHIQRPVLTPLQLIDPELDKSYTITAECEKLMLNLSQSDFTLLLKLFDLNFTYDDQMEEYINPKSKEILTETTGKFLYFHFTCKVMSLLLIHLDLELVEIFFANQEMKIWKYNNGSSVMNFVSGHLIGLIPTEAVNSENPEHAEIADAIFSISMDNMHNFTDLDDDDMRLPHVLFGPIGINDRNEPVILIDINTLSDGSRTTIIDITQLRLNFHIAAILQLQNYFYYGLPDYTSEADSPYDYMEKYRPRMGMIKKEVKTQYFAPELDLRLNIREPVIILPSLIHQRVLVVQSDFSYTFIRDPESIYLLGQTPNTTKSFEAMHLEIYTCKLAEFHKHIFTDIVKRKILEPVEVIYKSVQLKISPKLSSFNVDYLMGNFLFTLSHKDLLLIQHVYSFQKEILDREDDLISALKKSFAQKEDFLPRMTMDERNLMLRLSTQIHNVDLVEFETTDEHDVSPIIRSYTMQDENIIQENMSLTSLSIAGFTLIVLYDASNTYSPIIDVNATDFRFTIEELGNNVRYQTGASMRANFYNPILDTWEPFIENFAFQLESIYSPDNNPETQGILIIEKSTILNINISEIMVSHFLALAKGWRIKEDTLLKEVVSPISIRNLSGNNLLIEKISLDSRASAEIIKLSNGDSKYFEVESMHMKSINLSQEYLNVTVEKFPSCENIPINKVQSLTRVIKTCDHETPIVFDIELKDTCKIFTVRSSVMFKNETAHDMNILFSKKSMSDEFRCDSQESIPVPLQFIKHLVGIMPVTSHATEWHMVRLEELRKEGTVEEIRIGDFYLTLFVCVDLVNPSKITICIRPPIVIKNQVPRSIILQLFYNDNFTSREITILANGIYCEHSRSGSVDILVVLKIDHFHPSKQILLLSQREKSPKTIELIDYRKDILEVSVDHSYKGSHIFTFFCALTIINNTAMPLNFYYRKTGLSEAIGGQSYVDTIVPCSSAGKIAIGIGKEKSDWMNVAAVGVENFVEFTGEELEGVRKKYQFSYSVSLAKVLDAKLVFGRVVLITPKYVIINKMEEDVLVRQYHAKSKEILVERNCRLPFHWPDSEQPEMIRVKAMGAWSWSGQFSLENIGGFTIQNRHRNMMNHFKLINIEVKIVERSFYIILEKADENFCSYRIENHSQKVILKAYQKGCKEETRYLHTESLVNFAWSRPQQNSEIMIEFCEESFDEHLPVSQLFSFHKVNQTTTVNLKNNLKIYAKIECEGPAKVLKFSDTSFNSRKFEDEKIKTQYSISIPSLGISVIEYFNDTPQELLYFSMNGITFFALENTKQWIVELLVGNMQIDNQVSVPAIYPVILSPGKLDEKNVLHLSFFYNFTNNQSIYCFDSCEFLMQELAIKLESKMLQKTVEMVTRLFFNSSVVIMLNEVYKNSEVPRWMSKERIEPNKRFYFAKLGLSPIKIVLSLIPIKEDSDVDVYGKVSKALGMAITTIDLAPLKLNSLEMTDAYGSQWQIFSAFQVHYGKQLIKELLSLIGHAEILGNPIGLLNNLGTGVKDFFYEPAQGMVHGPLSAGMGFIKGTGSLLKNTVEGTFDTVSKLANSMATGITTLTQDREYLKGRQREQARNKPKNIVDGVEMGVRSLFLNLGKGISGVVSEPVKGYKKGKFTGMLIGSMRGLSGLVVKPVAGVLDVASKAAEGIKNTAGSNNYFGKSERIRPPRVFYGKNSVMKQYVIGDSKIFSLIAEVKHAKYLKEKFVDFLEGSDARGMTWVVYLFVEKIVLFAVKKRKVKWEIDIETVKACELEDNGLKLKTSPSTFHKTKGKTTFVLPFSDLRVNHKLLQKISELLPTS